MMCLHAASSWPRDSLYTGNNTAHLDLAKVPHKCSFLLAGTTLAGAGTFSFKQFHLNCQVLRNCMCKYNMSSILNTSTLLITCRNHSLIATITRKF